jgi:hypothetical protein
MLFILNYIYEDSKRTRNDRRGGENTRHEDRKRRRINE